MCVLLLRFHLSIKVVCLFVVVIIIIIGSCFFFFSFTGQTLKRIKSLPSFLTRRLGLKGHNMQCSVSGEERKRENRTKHG